MYIFIGYLYSIMSCLLYLISGNGTCLWIEALKNEDIHCFDKLDEVNIKSYNYRCSILLITSEFYICSMSDTNFPFCTDMLCFYMYATTIATHIQLYVVE